MDEELTIVQTVIANLTNDNVNIKKKALEDLTEVALVMGPERTREEVVPYVSDLMDDNASLVTAIIDALTKLVGAVGGPQYAYTLFAPLEEVVVTEDQPVREHAVKAIQTICADMSAADVEEHLIPMIGRLVPHEWFAARMSAAALLATALRHIRPCSPISTTFQAILSKVEDLATDDTPMVRRSVCMALGSLVPLVGDATLAAVESGASDAVAIGKSQVSKLVGILSMFARESDASSREAVLLALVSIKKWVAGLAPPSQAGKAQASTFAVEVEGEARELLESLANDTLYRVRRNVVEALPQLSRLASPSFLEFLSLGVLPAALTDSEVEVRAAAINVAPWVLAEGMRMSPFPLFLALRPGVTEELRQCKLQPAAVQQQQGSKNGNNPNIRIFNDALKALEPLHQDTPLPVRLALAVALPELAALFVAASSATAPLPLELTRFMDGLSVDPAAEVRQRLVESCGAVAPFQPGAVDAILDQRVRGELQKDAHWRTRMHLVRLAPFLIHGDTKSGAPTRALVLELLSDPVLVVRRAAGESLALLLALGVTQPSGETLSRMLLQSRAAQTAAQASVKDVEFAPFIELPALLKEQIVGRAEHVGDAVRNEVVPVLRSLMASHTYLHRQTALYVVGALMPLLAHLRLANEVSILMQFAVSSCSDIVANVRLVASETLEQVCVAHPGQREFQDLAVSSLSKILDSERDPDVFAAAEAAALSIKAGGNAKRVSQIIH